MPILTNIIVTALAVGGVSTHTIAEEHIYDFYDPLNYLMQNYVDHSNQYSYHEKIKELEDNDFVAKASNITILTHGMGGDAIHWLVKNKKNNYIKTDYQFPFALTTSSERKQELGLSLKNKEIIYKIKINKNYETNLYKLVEYAENEYVFDRHSTNIDKDDINNQIVLIYEGPMGSDNDTIEDIKAYDYFDKAIDSVLSEISQYQYNNSPSINLIGHSRGGLINLIYAYEHQKVVNNLISLGTPYLGSNWANIYVNLFKLINGNYNFTAYDDMLDESHFEKYSYYLNSLEGKVNSFAFGFAQTYVYFANTIVKVLFGKKDVIGDLAKEVSDWTNGVVTIEECKKICDKLLESIKGIINICMSDETKIIIDAIEFAAHIMADYSSNEYIREIGALIANVGDIINSDFQQQYISSDVCVNLNSQLGKKRNDDIVYRFSNVDTIVLGDKNNDYYYTEEYCSSSEQKWVGHNFETKNPTVVKKIINILNSNQGFHEHSFNMNINSSVHYKKCSCDIYEIQKENHSFETKSINSKKHKITCVTCNYGYENEYDHKFTYINQGSSHIKKCEECLYQVVEQHVDNYYKITLKTHQKMCYCGANQGIEEAHDGSLMKKCSICGFTMKDTEFPPIVPGKPIIKPQPTF